MRSEKRHQFSWLKPSDLARAVDLQEPELWKIARRHDDFFLPPRIKTTGKKRREIDAPKHAHKKLLRRLHRFFQQQGFFHDAAYGGVKGRSCIEAAERHCGRAYIVTRDISDCFPSIRTDAIRNALLRLGFRSDTARMLSLLFVVRGRIPQGSPLSNDALNLYLYALDEKAEAQCASNAARYHRFCDDMVISTQTMRRAQVAGRQLEDGICDVDLRLNEKKREQNGIQGRNQEQLVHNAQVNSKSGTAFSRRMRETSLDVAKAYVCAAKCVQADSLESVARKRAKANGYLHHARQFRSSNAKHLQRLIRQGDQHVFRVLAKYRLNNRKWWVIRKALNRPKQIAAQWKGNCRIGNCVLPGQHVA